MKRGEGRKDATTPRGFPASCRPLDFVARRGLAASFLVGLAALRTWKYQALRAWIVAGGYGIYPGSTAAGAGAGAGVFSLAPRAA